MKRTRNITLLALTTIVAGLTAGCDPRPDRDYDTHVPATKPNGLRPRVLPNGELMKDADGNVLYEDDEKQHYTYHGGHFMPWYTRANGYSTIPGSGIAAPATNDGVSRSTITSRSVPVTRGGFGSSGVAHGGGSHGGSAAS